MLKESLGAKIKCLREQKGLSRERFCEDESQLTVRQLVRIENGTSLPGLAKLDYIHRQLDVPLSELIDDDVVILPPDYLKLKLRFLKYNAYHLKERMAKKERMLEELYDRFYDQLPEDEQVAIDIFRATIDVSHSSNPLYGEPIIQDYFEQVKQKQNYSLTDLMTIRLYFISLLEIETKDYPKEIIHRFISCSTKAFDYTDSYLVEYGVTFYTTCLTLLDEYRDYEWFELVLALVKELLHYSTNLSDRSIILMLEAKYLYFEKNDQIAAENCYEKAIKGAEFSDNQVLKQRLEAEWQKDREACAQQARD